MPWDTWPDLSNPDVREDLGRQIKWFEQSRCWLCRREFLAGEVYGVVSYIGRTLHRSCLEASDAG